MPGPKSVSNMGGLEIKKSFNIAAAAMVLSLLTAGIAEAATYIATRTVGDGTIDLSITTDGTIGVLRDENILDWTFVLNKGGLTDTAYGPAGGAANSVFTISGSGFSATATDLTFDFSMGFTRVVVQRPTNSTGSLWCLMGTFPNCYSGQAGEGLRVGYLNSNLSTQRYSGVQSIASISSAVPEPATWAMMIIGFGAVGSMVRASRRQGVLAVN